MSMFAVPHDILQRAEIRFQVCLRAQVDRWAQTAFSACVKRIYEKGGGYIGVVRVSMDRKRVLNKRVTCTSSHTTKVHECRADEQRVRELWTLKCKYGHTRRGGAKLEAFTHALGCTSTHKRSIFYPLRRFPPGLCILRLWWLEPRRPWHIFIAHNDFNVTSAPTQTLKLIALHFSQVEL